MPLCPCSKYKRFQRHSLSTEKYELFKYTQKNTEREKERKTSISGSSFYMTANNLFSLPALTARLQPAAAKTRLNAWNTRLVERNSNKGLKRKGGSQREAFRCTWRHLDSSRIHFDRFQIQMKHLGANEQSKNRSSRFCFPAWGIRPAGGGGGVMLQKIIL